MSIYVFHTWGYWCAQTVRVPVFLCSSLPLTVNTAVPIPEWSSQIIHTIACTMDVAEYHLFVTKEFLSIGGVALLFSFAKLTKPGVRLASFCDKFGTARNSGHRNVAVLGQKWPYFTVPSTPKTPVSPRHCSIECSLTQAFRQHRHFLIASRALESSPKLTSGLHLFFGLLKIS